MIDKKYINKFKQVIGIIPARLASTRLPNKPLADINGKCLLQRVWEATCQSEIMQRVIIATDSYEIVDRCFDFGAEFIMTESECPSGTDRIMQAFERLGESADIIVNIQGDEPLLTSEIIDNLIWKFVNSDADVGTLAKKIDDSDELHDENVVKVKFNKEMIAESFSRKPVPYFKETPKEMWISMAKYWKHIGIYVYKTDSLKKFAELPVSEKEKEERLEQHRLMDYGHKYLCVETDKQLIGVDTPEDLELVREILSN